MSAGEEDEEKGRRWYEKKGGEEDDMNWRRWKGGVERGRWCIEQEKDVEEEDIAKTNDKIFGETKGKKMEKKM